MCISNVLIVEKDFDSSYIVTKKIKGIYPEINVLSGGSSLKTIRGLLKTKNPELLIINLDDSNGIGFKLLEKIIRKKFEILFISNQSDLAIKAFQYTPIDFLLKPLDNSSLKNALQKASILIQQKKDALSFMAQQTYKDTDNIIKVASSEGQRYIHINDIVRFEADGVYTKIILNSKESLISSSNLGKYEQLLFNKAIINKIRFHRVHYKHLINLNYIVGFKRKESSIVLEDGSIISIAQRRLKGFKNIWKVA